MEQEQIARNRMNRAAMIYGYYYMWITHPPTAAAITVLTIGLVGALVMYMSLKGHI